MARDFRNLVAWQLSYALKCEVCAFTAEGTAARDFRYRDQIRDSSASAARNIAEGHGRQRSGEFAGFCRYALGSLQETRSSLLDGRDRGYLDDRLFSRLWNLANAAERATKNLMRALQRQHATSTATRTNPEK
jgi:four helix bundle protein